MVLPTHIWEKVKAIDIGNNVVELRGWNKELVGPKYNYLPSVCEICSPCLSHRDVYLKRVLGITVNPSKNMIYGSLLHEIFLEPIRIMTSRNEIGNLIEELARLKYKLISKLPHELKRIARKVFDISASLVAKWLIDDRKLPILVEPRIEASNVGISDGIRPDLVVGLIPVDFVVTQNNGLYIERKRLAITAYALALEAMTGNPINFGVLAIVRLDSTKPISWHVIQLTDYLREKFIQERDEVARIVEQKDDPGISSYCPKNCPWREVCHENPHNM